MPHRISINKLKNIDVLVLSGGKGSRLKKVVNDRPKPMAEIKGHPFLDILMGYISSFGFSRFILCTGYMADYIEEYYDNKESPFEVIVCEEKEPLGTGGAVKNAESLIKSDYFLVVNGDSLCSINFFDFAAFHERTGADISLALSEVDDASHYGSVELDNSGKILKFSEKKKTREKGLINAGMYFFNGNLLSLIPDHGFYSLENDFFPGLIKKKFYGFKTEGTLIDIGTPERYTMAHKILDEIINKALEK